MPKKFTGPQTVRVQDEEFHFNEFRERQKQMAVDKMARSIIMATKPDAKEEARKKNRATAKKAIKK